MRTTLRQATLLLAATALCLLVGTAVLVVHAAAADPAATATATGAAAASSKYAAPLVPAFERFFAQHFRVSVVTQSYGVFNATLRMRGSLNFPERVQGELIPLGEPRINRHTQTALPHFSRVRGVEDDRLSDIPFSATAAKLSAKKGSGSGGEFTATGEEERPSLLVLDLQLFHSDSTMGKAQVHYLPDELMALRAQREAMSEGTAPPAATVDFAFRVESPQMSGNPLSDTPPLARTSAAVIVAGSSKAAQDGEEAEAAKGEVVFRWITEHEFSASLLVPMADAGSAAAPARLERVWVYGYAAPSPALFDRQQRQVPWYNKYLMFGVAMMGFVVQVVSGWTEGKTKANKQAEIEAKEKQAEQAKLAAALKEQEKMNKKKK